MEQGPDSGPRFRYHHLHINTTDIDRALDFYLRVMGGTLDHTGEWNGRRTAAVDLGGIRLLISDKVYPFTANAAPSPAGPHLGLEHLSLTVDDIDQCVATLKRRGAEFFEDVHVMRDNLRIAIVRAPDNVRIELLPGRA